MQPQGVPADFNEHLGLMFDLQVLAFQTDLTRVITFMIAREQGGTIYPDRRRHRGAPSAVAPPERSDEGRADVEDQPRIT